MNILKFNRVKKTILITGLLLLLLPVSVLAYEIKTGDSVYVPAGETIEGNLYAAGSNINIHGKVMGDVICAGRSINITGEVQGDVICAGLSINVKSKIDGSLRLAGQDINFSGQAARNAQMFGGSILLEAGSLIGWDLLAAGNTFDLSGNIGQNLHGAMAKANISGQIGKNVSLYFDGAKNQTAPLTIGSTAKIAGDLKYRSGLNAAIASGSVISGNIIHNLPPVRAKSNFFNLSWWWKLIAIFSALVIGLVLISFWRGEIIKITDAMRAKAGTSLGWGLLALILTPLIAIVLIVTLIGIPLSLILFALWLIALYVSKVFTAILVGRYLISNFLSARGTSLATDDKPERKDQLIPALILGVIVIYLLFAVPVLGPILSFIAMLWGLGGIILMFKKQ